MPASTPRCINSGGPNSRILLPDIPVINQELRIEAELLAPFGFWQARPGEIFTVSDPQGTESPRREIIDHAGGFFGVSVAQFDHDHGDDFRRQHL